MTAQRALSGASRRGWAATASSTGSCSPSRDDVITAVEPERDASPPRGDPARRTDAAGVRQRPQPCLPSRPARPHALRRRHVLDVARPDVRARRGPRSRHLRGPGDGDVRRDGPRRVHRGRASSTTSTTTGRRSVRRPQRDRAAGHRCGEAGRDPAHPARRLLPRRRHRRRAEPGAARFSDGNAAHWIERVSATSSARRRAVSARRSTRCAPSTRSRSATVAAWARPRAAASRPRLRAAAGERRLPGRLRRDADRGARRRRGAGRAVHRRPCHPRRRPTTSRRWRPPSRCCCICPTTERELADGIGPTARLRDAGVELCIGSDSHAVIDPFEETQSGRARRASGVVAPRQPPSRTSC